jgi:hypothetical protein
LGQRFSDLEPTWGPDDDDVDVMVVPSPPPAAISKQRQQAEVEDLQEELLNCTTALEQEEELAEEEEEEGHPSGPEAAPAGAVEMLSRPFNLERINEADVEHDLSPRAENLQDTVAPQKQAAAEVQRAKAWIENFLKSHGYSGVNAKRTRFFKSKYPLHTAVKLVSPDIARLLLWAGADPGVKNSSGLTPRQLALRRNVGNSHNELINVLSAEHHLVPSAL